MRTPILSSLLLLSLPMAGCPEAVRSGPGALDAGLSPDTVPTADGSSPFNDAGVSDSGSASDAVNPPAPQGVLVINEVAPAGEPEDWFEVYNGSDVPIDLSDWTFSDSIDENKGGMFPAEVLEPGAYVQVFVTDEDDGFKLGADEELAVFDPTGTRVDSVDWADGAAPEGTSWARSPAATGPFAAGEQTPGAPNRALGVSDSVCGDGFIDSDETCDDGSDEAGDGCSPECMVEDTWECSGEPSVCEQVDGPVDPPLAPEIVINEVVAKAVDDGPDWVELFNAESEAIDLSGFIIGDAGPDNMLELAAGTTIPAGSYLVLEQGTDFDFGLGAADGVMLLTPEARIVDSTVWREGDAAEGTSWGRFEDRVGMFQTLAVPTPGAPNIRDADVQPPCGNGALDMGETCDAGDTSSAACSDTCQLQSPWGVVINEVLAKVDGGPDAIELMNTNAFPVDISGWNYTDDNGFPDGDDERPATLPAGTTLAPGSRLLLEQDTDFLFGLSDNGDGVTLTTSDTSVVVDDTVWESGDADEGTSWARNPDGTGDFSTADTPTPGAEN